ncbi:hypothetical protein PINS_up010270 [Pythium insidiosum]|nr:hypothetical protein PINS_up010270 [Pythium insidiosum]
MLVCVLFALLYVQVLSVIKDPTRGAFYALMIGSLALKAVVQEVAKRVMLRKNVKSVRTMFLVVALPTVLIDTQLRIVSQRNSDVQVTLQGTAILAFAEIGVRFVKALLVRMELHRMGTKGVAISPSEATSVRKLSRASEHSEMAQRKMKLLAFHSAETYADMLAEYIAVGCAGAVVFFYWDHPRYRLAETTSPANATTNEDAHRSAVLSRPWSANNTVLMGVQVVVEILVDVLSCCIESRFGVTFQSVRKHSVYLAGLSIIIAVINCCISSTMYIHTDGAPDS